jgi:hypothetical protein
MTAVHINFMKEGSRLMMTSLFKGVSLFPYHLASLCLFSFFVVTVSLWSGNQILHF